MKNLFIAMSVMLFLVGSAFTVNGKEKEQKNYALVVKDQGRKVELIFSSPEVKKVKVVITDSKDYTVFSESIHRGKFRRPYDLSKLKDGVYTVKISDGTTTSTEKIEIKSNFYSPDFQLVNITKDYQNDDRVILTAVSGKEDYFSIKIFNEKEEVIHHSFQQVKNSFGTAIKLRDLNKKKYTIEVSNGDNELLKRVVL